MTGDGVLRTCTVAVDFDGNLLRDLRGDDTSLSLQGCGECFQDFDYAVAAKTHGGENTMAPVGPMFMGGGMPNTDQIVCRDIDLDGHFAGKQFFAENGGGLAPINDDTRACQCGGNDCQPRYGHIYFGAPEVLRRLCDFVQHHRRRRGYWRSGSH